ncbi:amino acid/amide ABC transporter ATP-binding protein 1, HAAT family [Halovenus aranensis]|uniref:Amino acid/amide ABC transporter ATP-binding protein 1, HAAT family n=1 Tax=Halovenus aranensis TaxID=890420 RepID=A0A1G8X2U6_9EURY|nr:ABC transporter ATP-binding protein [Halovenus aranensis]SDJ84932.1 amino acid/amide ABC transporter ATP-binding protein 1, HAAT family [Halovenus aranensis]
MLRTTALTKRFGGLTAVDSVDFELDDRLTSLIGPNGAGKTTFFNLLTGALEPSEGSIELGGADGWADVTDDTTYETAQLGVHRSYQITNVFPTSSVLENVRIAQQAHSDDSWRFWRNVNAFDDHYERAHEILERVGLDEKASQPAENLSHGEKRQLEVGIALAGDPDVLLLDEPNAGVSTEDVDSIRQIIEDVATDHAVLLVEHNMDLVMDVSDRIVVLNQGEIIADGEPDAIRGNPEVQDAYLGGYEPGDLQRSEGVA